MCVGGIGVCVCVCVYLLLHRRRKIRGGGSASPVFYEGGVCVGVYVNEFLSLSGEYR